MMNFRKFVASLFLMYGISSNLVKGQEYVQEEADCSMFFDNLINEGEMFILNKCSSLYEINCDNEGHITSFKGEKEYLKDEVSINNCLQLLSKFSTLETLDLSDLDLKKIPYSIFEMTFLKSLILSENEIIEIPTSIEKLNKLEELYLADNNIVDLPNEMFNLNNLKILDLAGNSIKVISPHIMKLSSLEELNLSFNKITELSSKIFKLNNLRILDLNENRNLYINMSKFSNLTFEECKLNNIKVKCYEPHTCKSIQYNNTFFTDEQFAKNNKLCKDIVEISNESNQSQNSFSFVVIGLIILGGIVVILTAVLFAIKLFRKNRSKKVQEITIIRSNEELSTEKNNEKKNDEKIPNKLEREFLFQNILND